MPAKSFPKTMPIRDIINQTLTLLHFKFTESVFGTTIYITARVNDTGKDIIFYTGSAMIVELFKVFDEPEDVSGMQVAVRERGKSYLIEDLSEEE